MKKNSAKKIAAVIGANTCNSQIASIAYKTGRIIAQKGYVLICGGRGGVMSAACKGAKSAGGQTIGILPGSSKSEANPYIDIPIVTAMASARNAIIVRSADIIIAISGKYGTLSEIALAKACGKKVYGLKTWNIKGVKQLKSEAEIAKIL